MLNAGEKRIIQEKLDEQQKIIKAQHRLPKSERNERMLKSAMDYSARFKRWLTEDITQKPVFHQPKVINKKETLQILSYFYNLLLIKQC